jgi:CBS domain-containing protein
MTRIEESRNSQSRENETREETEYVFEEPNATHIPRAVEERFKQQNMSLGWLRILLNGQDDYQEIGKKQQQGWEFVEPDEVPEMGATSVVREEGRYAGVVSRGDIALGKIPTVKLEAKQKHYRNKANEMLEAVNSQLMRHSNSRMPITNNSKSRTFKGRAPSFQE